MAGAAPALAGDVTAVVVGSGALLGSVSSNLPDGCDNHNGPTISRLAPFREAAAIKRTEPDAAKRLSFITKNCPEASEPLTRPQPYYLPEYR